jgi:hypothetical protein
MLNAKQHKQTADHLAVRAGRCIAQPGGYRASIPNPLPSELPVRIAGDLQGRLSEVDRALGRLDGSLLTVSNPDLLVSMYFRKQAVLSGQIEGTQGSLQDLLAAEARHSRRKPPAQRGRSGDLRSRHESRPRAARKTSGLGPTHPRDPRTA